MLKVDLDTTNGIVMLQPDGELSAGDFKSAAEIIDPYLQTAAVLKGIIIHTESFPGWDSFAALTAHLKFVREHHQKIARVAFSTDSSIGNIAERIADHFISAEIKSFSYSELDNAKQWILDGDI